jgi:hypothetical protein
MKLSMELLLHERFPSSSTSVIENSTHRSSKPIQERQSTLPMCSIDFIRFSIGQRDMNVVRPATLTIQLKIQRANATAHTADSLRHLKSLWRLSFLRRQASSPVILTFDISSK